MKKLFFALLIIIVSFVSGNGQNKAEEDQFILSGEIKGQLTDSVVLYYGNTSGERILQSCVLNENGCFTFKGQISNSEPQMVMLTLKEKGEKSRMGRNVNRINFLLEATNITFVATVGAFDEAVITGSKSQAEMDELKRLKIEINPGARLRNNEKQSEIDYAFFEKHPDSYVTALHLLAYVSRLSLEKLNYYYNRLSPNVKQSSFGKRLELGIKRRQAGIPGNMAANFTTMDINGKSLSLSDFRGEYILLDFWATWCVPCRRSFPHLLELYSKYKDKGLEIICVGDNDKNPDQWKAAIEKDGIGLWHHVLRGMNMDKELRGEYNDKDISGKYGIRSLPTKILIDPHGKIIGRFGGGGNDDSLDKKLEEVFKE